ncbi:hypothetical protein GQ53DRAFT_56821 [Thozetella sp. PMI_491]|nr:hypothetical protein GQ53DRAFT_56821 [Thozetella sp. PMI_491]
MPGPCRSDGSEAAAHRPFTNRIGSQSPVEARSRLNRANPDGRQGLSSMEHAASRLPPCTSSLCPCASPRLGATLLRGFPSPRPRPRARARSARGGGEGGGRGRAFMRPCGPRPSGLFPRGPHCSRHISDRRPLVNAFSLQRIRGSWHGRLSLDPPCRRWRDRTVFVQAETRLP